MYDASNWKGYVDEVCSSAAGVDGVKRMVKKAYLTGLGALLCALERLPRRNGAASGGLAASIAQLAPTRSSDVKGSSTWSMRGWK